MMGVVIVTAIFTYLEIARLMPAMNNDDDNDSLKMDPTCARHLALRA